MDTYIGLIALILSVINAWTLLRAIARGARAARLLAANAGNAVIGKFRNALRAAARVRDHRSSFDEKAIAFRDELIGALNEVIATQKRTIDTQHETIAMQKKMIVEMKHSSEVVELFKTMRYDDEQRS